ncbi:unnamed protein product [Rotaria sordida]|uniref:Major facilitator superfamily (MFS) profile domain-containing protein n=1 Tax=Rotaria sordida TaxID=392033 RepID=A0A814A913_9BILA|nr:unnamed protein product [Rotaria sordida]CAF0924999.1 unnamed protein product [Rotaria sordida]
MIPVSQLSCLWFSPNERTRATTVAIMANSFGSTASFLINPSIVARPTNLPYLLYFHFALALLAAIPALIYFPAEPQTPPSHAAQILMRGKEKNTDSDLKTYIKDLRQCVTNRSFVLLVTVGGLMGGTFAIWTGLFSTILAFENYSEKQAGWFAFGSSFGSIVGGFCMSALADIPRFQRSLKTFILLALIGCLLSVMWFQLSIRTIFYNVPILGSNQVTIGISLILVGVCRGAALPLIYESLAEITFPLPESLSASVLLQLMNITAVILLFSTTGRYKLMNLIVVITNLVSVIMVVFVRVSYKRRNEDGRMKNETILGLD